MSSATDLDLFNGRLPENTKMLLQSQSVKIRPVLVPPKKMEPLDPWMMEVMQLQGC